MNMKEILRGVLLSTALLGAGMAANVVAATHPAGGKDAAHPSMHASAGKGEHAPKAGTININTADAQALADALQGIGLSKAQLIVAYRKEHGKFDSADQLGEVKGIGKKTLEKNRAHIVVK